jgi:hypothetical protein
MPQSPAIATHAVRDKSWMLPEAKRKDLLYVADSQNSNVRVYSYPEGAPEGTLSGIYGAWAACTDKQGDIFISSTGYSPEILEYRHGGKSPIAELQDGDSDFPTDCSVDPTTGNLAVVNASAYSGEASGNVAIYAGAQGEPTFIPAHGLTYLNSCAYDKKGNLYVDGMNSYRAQKFAVLKRGDLSFKSFKLNPRVCCLVPLTWHDDRLDVASGLTIYEFRIKGRSGRETDDFPISGKGINRLAISHSTLVGSGYDTAAVYFWPYPSGGSPYKTITQGLNMPEGVAISLAR